MNKKIANQNDPQSKWSRDEKLRIVEIVVKVLTVAVNIYFALR